MIGKVHLRTHAVKGESNWYWSLCGFQGNRKRIVREAGLVTCGRCLRAMRKRSLNSAHDSCDSGGVSTRVMPAWSNIVRMSPHVRDRVCVNANPYYPMPAYVTIEELDGLIARLMEIRGEAAGRSTTKVG